MRRGKRERRKGRVIRIIMMKMTLIFGSFRWSLSIMKRKTWKSGSDDVNRNMCYGMFMWQLHMIDRSKLPFEENVREVREVVRIAHAMGVSVEAELGHVGTGTEYDKTRDSGLTHKEEARRFVEETGVDALAVAVGTSHGVYKGTPKLEFELLREIASLVTVPLVLHGGSGTGDENLKKCIACGIQKINLFTDMANPAGEAMALYMRGESSEEPDISAALEMFSGKKKNYYVAPMVGAEVYQRKLEHYIRLFGSAGKA